MYNKQWIGVLLVEKSEDAQNWVKWIHEPAGIFHCLECLQLDGCWFYWGNVPSLPHHPNCHCRLESIDYLAVLMNASASSDYIKFDPYLFDPNNTYKHGKNKVFESWGYTVGSAKWLQEELERQAREKYVSGNYELGKLDTFGQRINIIIEIPRKDKVGTVSFISGWMLEPNGKLKLNTPYGGK